MGRVEFKHGALDNMEYTDFLTQGGKIKSFCNNYGGEWGYQIRSGAKRLSGTCVAGLFGLMAEGSIVITTEKLNFQVCNTCFSWVAN